jgi:hypothetical protein
MRAFRPSQYAPVDEYEYEEEQQRDKEANMERYAKRAQAGMPLFETVRALGQMASRSPELVQGD